MDIEKCTFSINFIILVLPVAIQYTKWETGDSRTVTSIQGSQLFSARHTNTTFLTSYKRTPLLSRHIFSRPKGLRLWEARLYFKQKKKTV